MCSESTKIWTSGSKSSIIYLTSFELQITLKWCKFRFGVERTVPGKAILSVKSPNIDDRIKNVYQHTPNCNNVVIEKSKKQKAESQIGIN